MSRLTTEQVIQLALQQHKSGKFAQAEGIYRQVLSHQPNHHDAMQLLGALAYQVGRHQEAADLIRRAIGIAPDIAHYHNNLGSALLALDKREEAISAFQ